MKTRKLLLSLVVIGLLLGAVGRLGVQRVSAGMGWQTAYDVRVAYRTHIIYPHYGAFFSGSHGTAQYYTGSDGEPENYSSWDWWGDGYKVLLLEKSWLTIFPDLYPQRWNPANHHAFMVGY